MKTMKHFLSALVLLSVSVIAGCQQAHTSTAAAASSQPAAVQPQGKEDFYLTAYKNHAGPNGMDVFTFTHQGKVITATCEQDGGNGSCAVLIPKVGQHLFGSDEVKDLTNTGTVTQGIPGELVLFPGPATPRPDICKGCGMQPKELCTLWIQSVEVK